MTGSGQQEPAVAVHVRRGQVVESAHRVSFAVVAADGRLVHSSGDMSKQVLPRSAIKPLQALPLIESGAADRFALTDEELAIACASHSGEPIHVETVARWLARLGVPEAALACGAHMPYAGDAARTLIQAGKAPGPLHNNCSGKHTGMLTLALHLGVPLDGYLEPGHPVQRRIAAVLQEMAALERLPPPAIDGCGVPTWPMPLPALALLFARLGAPDMPGSGRASACRRVFRAIRDHPHLLAGQGRPCTTLLREVDDLVVKTGAEGVYAAALPARGLGIALKVEDGATRASSVALVALLEAAGLDAAGRVPRLARPKLRNRAGHKVGEIVPAPGWPPAGLET